ncbi:hypothetical protein [Bradyrhizobium centrosematis]|uniref:hypothetical protein n=1 Tax=Bradyrhizobium centrosematis TaxID=1300039 RepID=UPI002166C2D1|nr:hypothetical protein [Bradyrhizobium centrosematis]MCS3765281.1 hypothetical protein [Bradyrhizobium centrosematis]MCS3774020.1 hypothetical protein [Bradyrhizobium centrosematis]
MSNTFDYSAFLPSESAFLQASAKRVRALIRRTTHQLIEIGDTLAEIKKRMPHGQFTEFCNVELGLELRSVENYMSLAEFAKTYPPALVARLPARAGYTLAEKSAPADTVAEIMSEVSSGKLLTISEVKNRLETAKHAERSSTAPDIAYLADRLLNALDVHDIGDLVFLLGTATRSTIAAFRQRLQQGLEHRRSTTATTLMLPQDH